MTEPHDLDPELDRELEALGELRRREWAARPREWERFAAGEISVDEVRRLRLAAGDDPATVERGLELFRPYDELEQRRLLVELRRRPSSVLRLVSAVGIVPAAAAALLLWVMWPNGSSDATDERVVHAGDFEIAVEHGRGLASVRGTAEDDELVYAATTPLQWTVRPEHDIERTHQRIIDVLACNDAGCAPLEFDIRWVDEFSKTASTAGLVAEIIENSGTVRIHGKAGQLGLQPGKWTIWIGIRQPRIELVEAAVSDPRAFYTPDHLRNFELTIIQ